MMYRPTVRCLYRRLICHELSYDICQRAAIGSIINFSTNQNAETLTKNQSWKGVHRTRAVRWGLLSLCIYTSIIRLSIFSNPRSFCIAC